MNWSNVETALVPPEVVTFTSTTPVVPEAGVTHLELTGDEDGNPPEYEPELELEIETDK